MKRDTQRRRAAELRELHDRAPLVLPNAWDAASARMIERAGAKAVATTSAGVAWAHGYQDGGRIGADRMLAAIEEIVAAVGVPVTADVESGYGDGSPAAVEEIVRRLLDLGVAGMNLEDSPGADGALRSVEDQEGLIAAARRTAGADLVINARTDGFLLGVGDPGSRLEDTIARGQAYRAVGADVVFVPGTTDPHVIRRLAERIEAPLNVMAGPGAPTVGELAALGVTRISLGPATALAAYDLIGRAARDALEQGSWDSLDSTIGFGDLDGLFTG